MLTPRPRNFGTVPTNSMNLVLGGKFLLDVSNSFFKKIPTMLPLKKPKFFLNSFLFNLTDNVFPSVHAVTPAISPSAIAT